MYKLYVLQCLRDEHSMCFRRIIKNILLFDVRIHSLTWRCTLCPSGCTLWTKMMYTLTRWCTLRLRIYSATLWWTYWPWWCTLWHEDVLPDIWVRFLILKICPEYVYSLTWGWARWPEDELSELKKIWPEDVHTDLRIPLWPVGEVSDHAEATLSVLKINPLTWSCNFWPEMT